MFTAIPWEIEVNPFMNTIHAQTIGAHTKIQIHQMILSAVDLIHNAARFNGRPCPPPDPTHSPTVHFSLIFQSASDMHKFIINLQNPN